MSRSKDQLSTYERNTAQLETEIEELRQEVQSKEALIDEHKEEQNALKLVSLDLAAAA